MKSAILLFAAVILTTGAFAQTKMQPAPAAMKDCVMMKDGKMWVIKNMTSTTTLKNGTMVMTNGTAKTKDGKTMTMKNGECMDWNGTTSTTCTGDCVMMKDGKMMTMMIMDKTMTMKNGTMVMTDGSVKMKDGKTMKMTNGDWMDMDGTMGKK